MLASLFSSNGFTSKQRMKRICEHQCPCIGYISIENIVQHNPSISQSSITKILGGALEGSINQRWQGGLSPLPHRTAGSVPACTDLSLLANDVFFLNIMHVIIQIKDKDIQEIREVKLKYKRTNLANPSKIKLLDAFIHSFFSTRYDIIVLNSLRRLRPS